MLTLLPIGASRFDLDAAFDARGAEIVACDVRRELAVDVHAGEHADEDAWLKSLPESDSSKVKP